MSERWIGSLIRKKRLEMGWSQDGLCRGICAVSYLSRIEHGKADCSPELRKLLMERLCATWNEDENGELHDCAETLWQSILNMDHVAYHRARFSFHEKYDTMLNSPLLLDALLLNSWEQQVPDPMLNEFHLTGRQKTLFLLLTGQNEEAVQFDASAFTCCKAGIAFYEAGQYPAAIEYLQRSYDKAAQEGLIYIMLNSRVFLGNCCSNLMDYSQMDRHYRIAERIAEAVSDTDMIYSIRYNRAATALELGRIKEALTGLSALPQPTPLTLHKLAICHEKLGNKEEALHCLEQAEDAESNVMDAEEVKELCAVVRYRLEHPDYLNREEYGKMLLKLFSMLRASLPHGYAAFHLPYVLEWYKANRQYKQAMELTTDFPNQFKYT